MFPEFSEFRIDFVHVQLQSLNRGADQRAEFGFRIVVIRGIDFLENLVEQDEIAGEVVFHVILRICRIIPNATHEHQRGHGQIRQSYW